MTAKVPCHFLSPARPESQSVSNLPQLGGRSGGGEEVIVGSCVGRSAQRSNAPNTPLFFLPLFLFLFLPPSPHPFPPPLPPTPLSMELISDEMWRKRQKCGRCRANELQVEGLNPPELEPAAPDEPECVSARARASL